MCTIFFIYPTNIYWKKYSFVFESAELSTTLFTITSKTIVFFWAVVNPAKIFVSPWVDFTKLCAQSKKSRAHSARQKICRSVSPTLKLLNFANILRHSPNAICQKSFSTHMLVKLSPLVNFINILHASFSYKILAQSDFICNFGGKNTLSYKKRVRKMLMKLSPRVKLTNRFMRCKIQTNSVTFQTAWDWLYLFVITGLILCSKMIKWDWKISSL